MVTFCPKFLYMVPLVSYLWYEKIKQRCRDCFLCQKKNEGNSANFWSVDVCFSLYYIYLVLHVLISISFYFDWLIVLSLSLPLCVDIVLWLSPAFTNLYGKSSRIFTLSNFISLKFEKKQNLISLSWFKTNFDSILWFINKWLGMKNEKPWKGSLIPRLCISHNKSCVKKMAEKCVSLWFTCTKYDFISDIFWMNKMELMMIPKLYIYLMI